MEQLLVQTKGVKVLVVDDNEVSLLIAKTIIEQYGIEADPVQSGEDALARIRLYDYDMVILDSIMPGMDGHETARHIRELPGEKGKVPVVSYTSNQQEETLLAYKDVGVEDVLVKPLNTIELTSVFLKYLPENKMIDAARIRKKLSLLRTETDTQEELPKTELQQMLSMVEGLDYFTGMHYAGNNEENYYRVLQATTKSFDEITARVREFYRNKQSSGTSVCMDPVLNTEYNYDSLRVDVHSMKGVCACIGMEELSLQAADLEQLVRNGTEDIQEQLLQFSDAMETARVSLFNALKKYEEKQGAEENEEIVPVSEAEYKAIWEATIESVKRFDIDAVQRGLAGLLRSTASPALRKVLKEAVNASEIFEYATVIHLLEENRI